MSYRINKVVILKAEPPQTCTDCGEFKETRPYGANMAEICFECAEKNPKLTEAMIAKVLFGKTVRDDN